MKLFKIHRVFADLAGAGLTPEQKIDLLLGSLTPEQKVALIRALEETQSER